MTSDPKANIVQYHVNSKDYETWVVNDFNRVSLAIQPYVDVEYTPQRNNIEVINDLLLSLV